MKEAVDKICPELAFKPSLVTNGNRVGPDETGPDLPKVNGQAECEGSNQESCDNNQNSEKANDNEETEDRGQSSSKGQDVDMARFALTGMKFALKEQGAYTMPPLPPSVTSLTGFHALLLERRNLLKIAGQYAEICCY